jgi:dTDP-4-amino-4,6-dideoxygalactose transaminase
VGRGVCFALGMACCLLTIELAADGAGGLGEPSRRLPIGCGPVSVVQIPANDFARQWRSIREDAIDALERVGRSGWLVLGEEVLGFERELAAWWGVAHAVGVASGLDALELALRCAGVRPGERVITTPLTAFATTLAILRAGAEPVWCDVEESGGLDLDRVDAALQADRSIRAVMPVHLYGHPLDPAALERLAAEYGVLVVEDCAQSAGAERDGRPTGGAGVAAGTSLYPTKNLGAMGDGGVLLTGDGALAERARQLRDYGQSARYEHVEVGLNSRLDELHAAILRAAMLPRLDGWLARRQAIAARYAAGLSGCGLRPIVARGGRSAHHLFPVEVIEGDPATIAEGLAARGVAVGRHYPFVCPDQQAARGTGQAVGSLPVARRLAARELSLPINPYLEDGEVEAVIKACRAVCA